MLNSKFTLLKTHFGIFQVSDWSTVEPAWILGIDGCGPQTLNYLRVLLAQHGVTLKNDRTPEYWQKSLPDVQIVDQLGDEEEGADRGLLFPHVIYVDTAEQEPYTFRGFRADANQGGRPLIVPTERRALGRHPDSLGDYSIDCGLGRCHVERKSMKDAHGTILGFKPRPGEEYSRRERFERELHNLAEMGAGLIVVECSLADLIRLAPQTDHRSPAENAKMLFRSVMSYQQEYRVPWMFAESRDLAEKITFRWLERFARKQMEANKKRDRELRRIARGTAGEKPAEKVVAKPAPAMAELF
jgi:hypothetical protein